MQLMVDWHSGWVILHMLLVGCLEWDRSRCSVGEGAEDLGIDSASFVHRRQLGKVLLRLLAIPLPLGDGELNIGDTLGWIDSIGTIFCEHTSFLSPSSSMAFSARRHSAFHTTKSTSRWLWCSSLIVRWISPLRCLSPIADWRLVLGA